MIKPMDMSYLAKMHRFAQFRKKYLEMSGLPILSRRGLKKLADRYDILITGSDEVWKVSGIRGFDTSYFLDFCGDKTKRVSYAASISINTKKEAYTEEIIDCLKKFHSISVRDAFSSDFILSFLPTKITEVLDPTFLTDFTPISSRPCPVKEKYILLYGKLSASDAEVLRMYASERELKIVSVSKRLPYADISFPNATPEEWLSLFEHAELIVTMFYHGLIFSLKNQKKFLMLKTQGKAAKVGGLAARLGIDDLLLESPLTEKKILGIIDAIDYERINQKINALREISLSFLKEALG
jgi:hypothetical protein